MTRLIKTRKQLCLLFVVALASANAYSQCHGDGGELDVYPTSPGQGGGCTVSDALAKVGHNTVLNLQPGQHQLANFSLVVDKTNITLAGNGSAENVTVTCSENIGLAFLNVSHLTFRNLTIQKCNLAGSHLQTTVSSIENNFFLVPPSTQVALLIGLSVDVKLISVRIVDNDGIGLLAMDTLGTFTVATSTFTSNSPTECYLLSPEYGVGGGAIFIYFKNTTHPSSGGQLVIRNSTFSNNSNCNVASTFEWYSKLTSASSDQNATYVIGGGGGLSVYTSQFDYPVSVEIEECYFQNNTARFGGGIFVGMFEGVNNFSVAIVNTNFISNGLDSAKQFSLNTSSLSSETSGASITLLKDIRYLSGINEQLSNIPEPNRNTFRIQECVFDGNIAYSGGAMIIQSQYLSPNITTLVMFKNCDFMNNRAYVGAVGLIGEQKSSGSQLGMTVAFYDCNFMNNTLITPNSGFLSPTRQSSSILEIVAMNVSFLGHTRFSTNSGTPIRAIATIVNIQGTADFTLNVGAYGGAMGLTSSSFLLVHNNSYIDFKANTAYVQGGALFIDFQSPGGAHGIQELVYYDCFLFFDKLEIGCRLFEHCPSHLEELNITLNFSHNDAPLGMSIFGSALKTCEWLQYLQKTRGELQDLTPYEVLVNISLLQFHPPLNSSTNTINTLPNTLLVADNINISFMPGEIVYLNITALDQLDQVIPIPVTSSVIDMLAHGSYKSQLGSSGYWFLNRQTHDSVPLLMRAQHEPSSSVNVTVGVYSLQSIAQLALTVTVQPCYPGFVFSNASERNHYQCECSDELLKYTEIQCHPDTASITVPNKLWVGNVSEGELVVASCFPGYCHSRVKNVSRGDFDSQCVNNRSGILCGKCREGFSVVLGDDTCLQCTNYSLLWLLYIIGMGFALMSSLGRQDITVKHGLINSVLFYSNIATIFRPYLIFQKDSYPLFVMTSWLSLNMGFEICLFDGMTALHAAYLYFVFPAFLWLLMGIIAILARYNRWPRYLVPIKNNTTATFATLMLMTYVTTLQNCTGALSFVVVDKIGIRWGMDPNLHYFSGGRIPLIIISLVVIFIYIIPAPILLLFPALTMRLWIGRKLLPIYDVLWAPFREKFHFWVGLRLVLRIIPFILGYFPPFPLNLLLLGIFIGLYLLAHTTLMPFKLASRNYLDTYLTVNLFLLTLGGIYFSDGGSKTGQVAYVAVLLSFAYTAFFVVYVYHFYTAILKDNEKFKKFQAAVVSKFQKWKSSIFSCLQKNTEEYSPINDEHEPLHVGRSRDRGGTGYREPLLSDNELEVYPTTSPSIPSRSSAATKPKKKGTPKAVTSNEIPAPTAEYGEISLRVNTT